MILDGKTHSQKIKLQIKQQVLASLEKPGLAVVLIGEDPASQVYVGHKIKACAEVGFHSEVFHLSANATESEVKKLILDLNKNSKIHGILIQLPIPKHLNTQKMLDLVDPAKDVDAIGTLRMGELLIGIQKIAPCTPSGIISLLEANDIKISGKHVVVVGRSLIVGKPMAQLLEQKNATVTLCHSKTNNLRQFTKAADIVVVAAGKKQFLGKDDFSPNAVVIDVGMHREEDGSLCGDVNLEQIKNQVQAYTPVPGGVGPLTIAFLLQNTLHLSQEKKR